jgi:hypothetical protein
MVSPREILLWQRLSIADITDSSSLKIIVHEVRKELFFGMESDPYNSPLEG